ncbi:unnamed protein product, partial [marine sediment metagenome]
MLIAVTVRLTNISGILSKVAISFFPFYYLLFVTH